METNLPFPRSMAASSSSCRGARGVAGGHCGKKVPGLCRRDRGERAGLRPRGPGPEPPTGRCARSLTSPTSSPRSPRSRWPGPCWQRVRGSSPPCSSATAGPRPTRLPSSTRACMRCAARARAREAALLLRGFHGRTLGSLSCTPTAKYQDPYLPLLPGVFVAPYNDVQALAQALDTTLPA